MTVLGAYPSIRCSRMGRLVIARLSAVILLVLGSLSLASCDAMRDMMGAPHRYIVAPDPAFLADDENAASVTDAAIAESAAVIQRRLAGVGIRVTRVTLQGRHRITIDTDGPVNRDDLAAVIAPNGRLEVRAIDQSVSTQDLLANRAPPGSEILPLSASLHQVLEMTAVRRLGGVSRGRVANAYVSRNEQSAEPVVKVELDQRGTEQMARFSEERVGEPAAFIVDDMVLSTAIIAEPITSGRIELVGNLTQQRAGQLAAILQGGELTIPFTIVAEAELD
ncbi:MAG: hypothetical protein KDE15_14825 [Erythrobacter sp.]|nr:hypothetical protein [Erythrobacter sp.]